LSSDNIQQSLNFLHEKLEELYSFYQQELDFSVMVYKLWNAKDILGHLTFWHESFARNISDMGKDVKPQPLKGKLSEVNQQSVATTKAASIPELIQRIKQAQETIEQYIFNDSIGLIPYKKGSRDYSRQEHLDIVAAHIKRHLKDLNKRYC